MERNSEETRRLLTASYYGQFKSARLALENGANIKGKDVNNRTPLTLAAARGHEAIVTLLLKKGASLKSKDVHDRTPLIWAAAQGHIGVVSLLLDKGPMFHAKDVAGRTALSWAAKNGHWAIVKRLVDKGAPVNDADETSGNNETRDIRTPLLWATTMGREAPVDSIAGEGPAGAKRWKDGKHMKPARGTNVNSRHRGQKLVSSSVGYEDIALFLIKNGADVECEDDDKRRPITWASATGQTRVVRALLDKIRAKVDSEGIATGGDGRADLLKTGLEVDWRDMDGRTPLSWAAGYGHDAIVTLLLNNGADVNHRDKWGRTPLSWAAGNGHVSAVQKLLQRERVEVNAVSKNRGWTPLWYAVYSGHRLVVEELLKNEHNADIDATYSKTAWTPLWWAAGNGYKDIAAMLLEKGAKLNFMDAEGHTPLCWAVGRAHWPVVQLLLGNGAALNRNDKGCRSLLQKWAEANAQKAVVKQPKKRD